MKRIISILTISAMLCGLSACSSEKEVIIQSTETTRPAEYEIGETIPDLFGESFDEPITDAPMQEPRLSDSCDKVLCKAQDGDDYYEMVANQSEDYSGVKTEIGVIKNNQWLQPLTSDHPFIDEENTMLGKHVNTLYDTFIVEYLGNGCFYYYNANKKYSNDYDDAFYNAVNGKSYSYYQANGDYAYRDDDLTCTYCLTTKEPHSYNYEDIIRVLPKNNDGKIILNLLNYGYPDLWVAKLLDLSTMEVSEIEFEPTVWALNCCYPYAEGLFAVCVGNSDDNIAFYDLSGKCVIDLSGYKTTHKEQAFFFENGLCTFNIINDNGTEYKITIDKTGQVVNSEQA